MLVTLIDMHGTERRVNPAAVQYIQPAPHGQYTQVVLPKAVIDMAEDMDDVEAMLVPLEITVSGIGWDDLPESIDRLREMHEAATAAPEVEIGTADPGRGGNAYVLGEEGDPVLAAMGDILRNPPPQERVRLDDAEVRRIVSQPPLGSMSVGATGDLQETVNGAQEAAERDGWPVLHDMEPWLRLLQAVDEDESAVLDRATALAEVTWTVAPPDAFLIPVRAIEAIHTAYSAHPSVLTPALDSALYDLLKVAYPSTSGVIPPRPKTRPKNPWAEDAKPKVSGKGEPERDRPHIQSLEEIPALFAEEGFAPDPDKMARLTEAMQEAALAYAKDRYGAQDKIQVVFVHSEEGDWQGLYIDGMLAAQDHTLVVEDFDTHVNGRPYEFESIECDAEWLRQTSMLPQRLEDVRRKP